MFMIHSMAQAAVWIAVTVYILLFLALQFRPLHPFSAAGQFLYHLVRTRTFLLHFAGVLFILLINKIEIAIEQRFPSRMDYTPAIYNLEGDFVAGLQRLFENDILTPVLTFFYVIVFPALMITSMLLYTYQKQYKLFYAVCIALMMNYMIAIPFYLLFPVTEAHAFHPQVTFLMLDYFPTFESEYRPLSDLDNCLPSLHTSISVSMAMIALRSNSRFWRLFAAASAALIVFSIFYLGVHWLTDMVAGTALGLLASQVALRISEGRTLFHLAKKQKMTGKWQ